MTLAHRFTLASEEAFDLDGAARWRARDDRLRRDVNVYVLASEHGTEVTAAVARTSTVRDPRLARVIASGTDTSTEPAVHYVVVDRPRGTDLGDALSRRSLPPRLAGSIVGSIARALVPLSARGIHHGAIRSSAVTVSEAGVPVLSGLGIDGHLRGDLASSTDARSRDAIDLVHLYIECVTGLRAPDTAVSDLPDEIPAGARALCVSVLEQSSEAGLSDVVDAFPPDHGALRGFAGAVRSLPLRAEVAQAEMHETFGRPAADIVSADVLSEASRIVAVSAAASHAAPDLRSDVASERLEAVAAALPVEEPEEEPVVEEPEVEPPAPAPIAEVPTDERDMFDDLAAFDAMSDEQNSGPSRSVWEAMVEPFHRRWPRSEVFARVYESAHARAGRPGPIRTRLLLLLVGAAAVVAAWMFALDLLEQPFTTDMDRHNPPPNSYPAYTYGPTASADDG
ncbi:hypothetical protein [Demequina sp. NBRC 110054]|uniref:hypothetical protein n=1 Tax=Demequina sp. NBRC 110054 TaxID=1570343 RepID=UPI0009FC6021|nr:hypothetical protein [Demequina sp. NBRC 110054]